MADYNFKDLEEKWQKIFEEKKLGKADDFSNKPAYYNLCEFPYPSGEGLHVGHCMIYGATDAFGKFKHMQGFNVMSPMGWDAFGLPTENYAIKNKIKPQDATAKNVANFRRQMKSIGYTFDWDREVNTTDPKYYRWTQWIFLQFYKHAIIDPTTPEGSAGHSGKLIEVADDDTTTPRLAFQAEMPVNWCPSCRIILANEEVISGKCERCGAETEKRSQKQWMLRITAYADRLIDDLKLVDFPEKVKSQQINWIGRSTGTNIKFPIKAIGGKIEGEKIEVFTTRADTLFGCTYVVLSPEHPLVEVLMPHIQNKDEVRNYIEEAKRKSDLERTELQKEKTGVKLFGIEAINPINNEPVAVYLADYVLASYGTGAVMAVPAHDERDWEFAKKYNIAVKDVVIPREGEPHEGAEFRKTVSPLIHRKSDNKFLMIKWKQFGWISPICGGIEDDEAPEQAAEREVYEETGYKVKAVEKLGGIVESHFFAENKNVWRARHDQHILCELIDENSDEIDGEEKDRHEPVWLTAEEALEKITHPFNKIGLTRYLKGSYANTEYGYLIDSGEFDGLSSEEAKKKITERLIELNAGNFTVNYKLRDWIFSRQHYWGEPIPIVHCEKCGVIPLPEDQLPLTLPEVEHYEPTETGESPLAVISDWVNTTCPKCGGSAKRETDTMPNWAGSSWYFIAYAISEKLKAESEKLKAESEKQDDIFDSGKEEIDYWMPVDIYNGGMEHTTLHLLYSRFWHKFLFDMSKVNTLEPYAKRVAHGLILGPDGQKMSKSRGNVINPDEIVEKFGADTLRTYIMFIGPYDQDSAWSTAAVQGVHRFLRRVNANINLVDSNPDENVESDSRELLIKLNQVILSVTEDLENLRFNTVVSKLMELNNAIEKEGRITLESYSKFLRLLFPAAPHLSSELWQEAGFAGDVFDEKWPVSDSNFLIADNIEVVVQINGKVRDRLIVSSAVSDEELKSIALNSDRIKSFIDGKEILKTIVVPKKLVNIVLK